MNVAAACVVAILAALNLSAFPGFWNSNTSGQFGFDVGQSNGPIGHGAITEVVPGSPAAEAGLKAGDTIARPATLRDRLLVIGELMPLPHDRLTMSIVRGGRSRSVTIEASSPAPLSLSDEVGDALLVLALLLYVVVGIALVLLRPGWMSWSFLMFAFALIDGWSPCGCWGYVSNAIPLSTYASISEIQSPLVDFGIVGILVFCLRFPTDAPTGWRRTIGSAAVYLAIAFTAVETAREWYLDGFVFDIADTLSHIVDVVSLGIVVAAIAVMVMKFHNGSELERHRIKWVVFGFVLAMIPIAATVLSWEGSIDVSKWAFGAINLLFIPLPIAIAYAVIRHRVIDVRFVLSRSLVIGCIGAVVAILAVGMDLVFGSKLESSRFPATAYVALALVVGFSLSSAARWLGRMTDALFFREWDRTQRLVGVISDAVRRAAVTDALREPLTTDLANALALASAALFERIESGGFVRTASSNWPNGTIWHMLPDDPATMRVSERGGVVGIDDIAWDEGAVPSGFGRPAVLVPISVNKSVAAFLLLGSHEIGTALDPDEVRMVRNIAADAGIVFRMARAGRPSYAGDTLQPART